MKVQVTIQDKKSIEIYESINARMKGKAIEFALKLLTKNKSAQEVLFGSEAKDSTSSKKTNVKSDNNESAVEIADWS